MYKLKAKRVAKGYFIHLGIQRIEKITGNNPKITEEGEIPKLGEDLTAGINELGAYYRIIHQAFSKLRKIP